MRILYLSVVGRLPPPLFAVAFCSTQHGTKGTVDPFAGMTDRVSPERRSRIMSRVRTKDTEPEMVVRKLLHRLGYRYRLHRRDLAGCPDIVFSSRRKVIFVHGCFWHAHHCRYGRAPRSRREYWLPKLRRNKERDAENIARLRSLGWDVLTVWQCQTGDKEALWAMLAAFLDGGVMRRAR